VAHWILIVGPKRSEKTTHALELVSRLRQRGVEVGGFVQVKETSNEGRPRYDLMRLRTGERIPLAGERPLAGRDDSAYFCSLAFQMDSFAVSRKWLEDDASHADVLFVGDVSKLEVVGEGHHATLTWALALEPPKVISICARSEQLFYIVEKLGLEDDGLAWLELPAVENEKKIFYERVVGIITGSEHHRDTNEGRQ